ncbi:MAG TPA: LptE family protein [Tepidisphaeraceae bacterium]|nr:LptE family protein [Tepidisphaeraceae bacterium]
MQRLLSLISVRSPQSSVLFLVLAVGCAGDPSTGPGAYQWKSLYRTDIHTVAVPIFGTRDFHRGVEFQVSDALVHEIEAMTPYKVVARDHADTILEGEVISVNTNPLSNSNETGEPQEQLATIVVDFTWKEIKTGKILVERKNFEQTATYYPSLGEGEFVGEQTASEKMALAIVHELEGAW